MENIRKKIAIIGGGPGGYVAAIRAAQLNADVVLIEKDKIGGTCLNVGCIPTKALLHSAEIYEEAINGSAYGVIAEVKLDFKKIQERKNQVSSQLVSGVEGLLSRNKVKVIRGTAKFLSANRLEIVSSDGSKSEVNADKIIIATGSMPVKPPIPGAECPKCIDSTDALALTEIPKSMVIVGGGVIGVEIATLYSSLGTKVTVVEMLKEILPMMDGELTKQIRAKLSRKGIVFYTDAKVTKISDKGEVAVVSVSTSDGKEIEVGGHKVLISVGRKTNISGLELESIGVKTERGKIIVDDTMLTNVNGIYAIGDCNGISMLAHVAEVQGEIAAENALDHESHFDIKTNPSCVFTKPEFASVGITEEKAKESGIEYKVGKFPLAGNGRALTMGEDGMVKLIVGKEFGEILGAHILGPRATELIAECALAIGLEATTDELISTIHSHPTISEAIREAAMASEKRALHIFNR